jgi:transitional endoplasmic reticulum ATPase
MPATKSVLSATQASHENTCSIFKMHCDGLRVDTKTTVLRLIRENYPDYHVTEVEKRTASLFEFAGTEKAELTIDAEDQTFNASREWKAVGEGIEKNNHPGELSDKFRFAR